MSVYPSGVYLARSELGAHQELDREPAHVGGLLETGPPRADPVTLVLHRCQTDTPLRSRSKSKQVHRHSTKCTDETWSLCGINFSISHQSMNGQRIAFFNFPLKVKASRLSMGRTASRPYCRPGKVEELRRMATSLDVGINFNTESQYNQQDAFEVTDDRARGEPCTCGTA